jgi:hypothetical protein
MCDRVRGDGPITPLTCGTSWPAMTCCVGPRVTGAVRLWRNYGQEASRPAGSGRSPYYDERRPGGSGARAGTPASDQLSRPSRSDSECRASTESGRSTSGAERGHPDRPGRDRAPSSSSSPPSWRPRLCARRAARASSPSPPPPSPPPSSSRVLRKRKGVREDALCPYPVVVKNPIAEPGR